jgi:hypothetical protein
VQVAEGEDPHGPECAIGRREVEFQPREGGGSPGSRTKED